jgi:hypothetical protein
MVMKVAKPDVWLARFRNEHNKHTFDAVSSWCYGWRIGDTIDGYSCVATPACPPTRLDLGKLKDGSRSKALGIVEICVAPVLSSEGASDPLTNRWQEVFRSPIIPFDPAARRQELKHAYEVVEPFIVSHERMKGDGVLY